MTFFLPLMASVGKTVSIHKARLGPAFPFSPSHSIFSPCLLFIVNSSCIRPSAHLLSSCLALCGRMTEPPCSRHSPSVTCFSNPAFSVSFTTSIETPMCVEGCTIVQLTWISSQISSVYIFWSHLNVSHELHLVSIQTKEQIQKRSSNDDKLTIWKNNASLLYWNISKMIFRLDYCQICRI